MDDLTTPYPCTCCLCGATIETLFDSHNPWPLTKIANARCCEYCNTTKVIPARIAGIKDIVYKDEPQTES